MTATPQPFNLDISGKKRTQGVVDRTKAAMRAMELEIDANAGLYPFNKGRVTYAEVCRRADVSNATLLKESHRETTRKAISAWLEDLADKLVKGQKSVRRKVTERATAAEKNCKQTETHYHMARLELQDARRKIRELQQELLESKAANAALVEALATIGQKKIVPLRPRNKT